MKVSVRFPNENYQHGLDAFEWKEFKPEKLFSDEVFGWYKGTYITLARGDYDFLMEKFGSVEDDGYLSGMENITETIIPWDDPELDEHYGEMLELEKHHQHEIIRDSDGVIRWKSNPTTREMINKLNLDDLWALFFSLGLDKNSELIRKMYRQMGYPLCGYWEIFHWEVNNNKADEYTPPGPPKPKVTMKNFNLEKFMNYVNTYDTQFGVEDYHVQTIIDDFLYGIGICLNEEKYKWSDGYQEFKKVIFEHLNK